MERTATTPPDQTTGIQKAEARLEELTRHRDRLTDAYQVGGLALDAFRTRVQAVEESRVAAELALLELRAGRRELELVQSRLSPFLLFLHSTGGRHRKRMEIGKTRARLCASLAARRTHPALPPRANCPRNGRHHVDEPGAYVQVGTGDLYRIPKEALIRGASPIIRKESAGASRLVRVSRNPFVTTLEARLICAEYNIEPNF